MTDNTCTHDSFQCVITSVATFPGEWELDGVVLVAPDTLDQSIVAVEMVCHDCGGQRYLADDEWEIA